MGLSMVDGRYEGKVFQDCIGRFQLVGRPTVQFCESKDDIVASSLHPVYEGVGGFLQELLFWIVSRILGLDISSEVLPLAA